MKNKAEIVKSIDSKLEYYTTQHANNLKAYREEDLTAKESHYLRGHLYDLKNMVDELNELKAMLTDAQ